MIVTFLWLLFDLIFYSIKNKKKLMKNMIITDADRAFSSLLEESTLGQNFNIIVSTLTPENGKYWESLATFIDGLEEFKPREFELLKIIEIGEQALLNENLENEELEITEEAAHFYIIYCLCYAFQHVSKPYSHCVGTTVLSSLINLIDESTAPMLIRICNILKTFCGDVKANKEYGENALALQCALKPLIFALMQIDLSTMESLSLECLLTTKEIFSLGDTPLEECNLLFELYTTLMIDDEPMVATYSMKCLAFFITKKSEYINNFTEEQFTQLIGLLASDQHDIILDAAIILSLVCRDEKYTGFFLEQGLPDVLFNQATKYANKRDAILVNALFDCILSLCENETSLIPFFFEHELFLSKCLMDISAKTSHLLLEISCMSLDECGEEDPPFITDIEQIVHVVEDGLCTDDKDVLDDSLTLLRSLLEHDCEVGDVRPQLEDITEHEDPDIAKEATELLEMLEEKEKDK